MKKSVTIWNAADGRKSVTIWNAADGRKSVTIWNALACARTVASSVRGPLMSATMNIASGLYLRAKCYKNRLKEQDVSKVLQNQTEGTKCTHT